MNIRFPMRCLHREHAPSSLSGVSRRHFLGGAAGLALGAGLSTTLGAQGGNPHVANSASGHTSIQYCGAVANHRL